MKILSLFMVLFFNAPPAFAGPISLLECELGYAPVQKASVSYYGGRFFLLTHSYEGEFISRVIPQDDWEKRILLILDTPERKGVLYRDEGLWYYKFKGENGWFMSGNANCSERR